MQGYVESDETTIPVDPKNQALSNMIVELHCYVRDLNLNLQKQTKKFNYITPRDFIDLITHFERLHDAKKKELNDLQNHIDSGLDSLKSTEDEVLEL